MSASGTYDFAPGVGEVILNALSRIGIRGPSIKAEHLATAAVEANLLQAEWANKGPTLWTVDTVVTPTVVGTATYPVPPETIMILNVTRGILNGDGTETDIVISPLSRQEYFSYPNKTTPGPPTSFWFDRQISPTITLWPVPDDVYNLNVQRFRQIQDANIGAAGNFQIPYRWLDAACAGLAFRLARHYATNLEMQRKIDYEGNKAMGMRGAYDIAADQDVEDSSLYILPALSGYYR